MRLIFLGSGEFGVPTLRQLADSGEHQVALVVSQPDRPAGRHRQLTPTPIASFALERNLPLIRPGNVNDPAVVQAIHAQQAGAMVVIAFGQKLGRALLQDRFAINLHASLLPKYRGAAPINWAMIRGETVTGVSVITLADRMDAGLILAQAPTPIDPRETAGELHDRLALLGPALIQQVLQQHVDGTLQPRAQSEAEVTQAPKFTKADGTVDFNQPAMCVRQRVHGLTPWPGCTVLLAGKPLRLHRVEEVEVATASHAPGTVLADRTIACARGVGRGGGGGAIRLLEVQPPGGRLMSFEAYVRGQAVPVGARCEAMP